MNNAMENNLAMPLKQVLEGIQKRITTDSHYMGIKTMKNPMDFWVYREVIFDQKPDVLIEIGNFNGGSTLAFAHILDIIGHGEIIAMDIDHSQIPDEVRNHPRISFIEGDACKNFEVVKNKIKDNQNVIVFEDSAHTYQNTLNVLNMYSKLIQPGGYIIIEDSICHHGLDEGPNPGPFEAIEEFLSGNREFSSDRDKENFGITWNPKGFVKKHGEDAKITKVNSGVSLAGHSPLRNHIRKIYINIMPPIIVSLIRKLRGTT